LRGGSELGRQWRPATACKDVAARPFGEFVLQRKLDCVLDTTRLRAHGFDGFEDTCRMFGRQFA